MAYTNFGNLTVLAGGFQDRNGIRRFSGTGFPKSGTSGTGVDRDGVNPPTGSLYVDKSTGVVFANEGSTACSYWTPVSFTQRALWGITEDFRNGLGKADADTGATATLVSSGLRIHGQGIAETDSGVTVTMSDQGAIANIHTTDEDEHTVVLSMGTGTTPVFKPSVNGTMAIDAVVAQSSAITARGMFIGFCSSAADALDPVVTATGTTISFAATIADDIAGLVFHTDLTDADRYFAIADKANTNASISCSATGVDTGVDQAVAGTYQRFRVEVDADGAVRMFIDKSLVATKAAATLTTTTAIHPVLQLISEAAAIKTALVKRFSTWGVKP
jgi:hypothetical protein